MATYTAAFKKEAVQKFLSRGNRKIGDVCAEIGIATPTIYRWSSNLKKDSFGGVKKNEKRPSKLSPAQKMKAVMEFESIPELERGAYLRREGFTTDQLAGWKALCEDALSFTKEAPISRADWIEINQKLKVLEADLKRKNSALAESSALLILKKKADLIWGIPEE